MRRSAGPCLGLAVILLAAGADGGAAQAPEPVHEAAATKEASLDWQGELDLIADLLIDGKPLEARERADHLLQVRDLPGDVASRARALREKADGKLAEPSRPVAGPAATAAAAAREQSFRVRVAAVGGGFSQGMTGVLRVSDKGLSFVPQGRSREDWAIRWPDLAEARSDTGLWDAPYPLVLIERGGRRRYVARLDQKGSYLPGSPLLSAIAERRRKQK